jgi:protein-tyrosine phosphatase
VIALTPHLRASEVGHGLAAARAAAHAVLRATLADRVPGVTLVAGFEVMLDDPGVELATEPVCLGSSRAVLVEFPRGAAPVGAERELARLRASGLLPVVAHPERCADVTPARAAAWRAAGAALQGDATTLALGGGRGRRARALLAAGAYDLLASDNHGDERSLVTARALLAAHGADDVAALLTESNPARLLADEAPHAVRPVLLPDGVWHEVRAWLLSRIGSRDAAPLGARPARPPSDPTA